MHRDILLLSVLLAAAAPLPAQEHAHTPSPEKLGTVHFVTSCNPSTVAAFDRAVALLHSFEFGSAIRGFNDVLAADSTCAMAYWGLALSRWSNPMAPVMRGATQLTAGRELADAARRMSGRVTERERLYIAAVTKLYDDFERLDQRARVLSYERAMRELVARQPADTEAKIFHAIALTAAASPTDKTYANQLEAGSILESIWAKQPNHPGLAHYIIHTYDHPALAARAAAAAARYAEIAPSAAHALHMPSHTFTRVGEWQRSIETNIRSYDVALRDGSIGEAAHANDYAAYAYLQLGRDSAANAIVRQLPGLRERYDPDAITGAAPPNAAFYAFAAIPARSALERRDWRTAASLVPSASPFGFPEAVTYFARALGAAHLRDTTTARAAVDSLGSIAARLRTSGDAYWAEQVAIQQLGASAWLKLVRLQNESALADMRSAATREDATDKSAITPGPLAPARELLGDMLMELGRHAEALAEYRSALTKEPNRFWSLYGAMRAAEASGAAAVAGQYRADLRALLANADVPGRPEFRDIRERR